MEKVKMSRATIQDSEPLKIFYSDQNVGGTVDLRMVRRGTFFDQYRLQTPDFETFLLKSQDGQESAIEGVGTLLFRKGNLEGELQTIGYATDLRISSRRAAIAGWAQHFLPLLKIAAAPRQCRYVFSVVPQDFGAGYNAL